MEFDNPMYCASSYLKLLHCHTAEDDVVYGGRIYDHEFGGIFCIIFVVVVD